MTIYAEKVVFAGKIVYTDYGYHIEEISLNLYEDEMPENVATEYETKFHNLGFPIYRMVVKKD